jgi:hypothetical protein
VVDIEEKIVVLFVLIVITSPVSKFHLIPLIDHNGNLIG